MEPILVAILTSLAAGAIAKSKDVASQAVMDAYEGLKGLIVQKLGKTGAVQSVEDEPESENAHALLAKALANKQLQADAELQQRAHQLEKVLAEANAAGASDAGSIDIRVVRGRVNAIVRNLEAAGRIKLDFVIADTGDATVRDLRAGGRGKG